MILQIGLIVILLVCVFTDLLALLLFKVKDLPVDDSKEWPMVSILVPMRNEAKNVRELLDNLLSLEYPEEKMELVIGEDRSTDHTGRLLKEYAKMDPRILIVDIDEDIAGLKGKANVIGQLIPYCSGQYYFITDADVRVPAGWIKALLSCNTKSAGVIGGTTVVKTTNFWSSLQQMDWLFAQGLLYVAGRIFQVVAVSGTNMMITKSACLKIGGYQNIPYSLTEDIGALTAAKRAGFTGVNILQPEATAMIEAQPDWHSLISQRGRWVYGVLRLPIGIIALLLIRALFLIAVILLAWWKIWLAAGAYLFKSVINLFLMRKVGLQIGQPVDAKYFLFFEVYWFLMALAGLWSHLFSSGTEWKGRKY